MKMLITTSSYVGDGDRDGGEAIGEVVYKKMMKLLAVMQ